MISTKQYDVTVIICVYTEARWSDLLAAITSLGAQSVSPREILVVVDHNPHLFQRVRQEIVDVIALENTYPRGLSGARNSGLVIARGAFVAFLDDDATAEPEWLECLIRACANPHILGAGGTVLPRWLDTCPAWFPQEFYWVLGCSYLVPPASAMAVRNPFGGCSCMRREIFTAVGGFRDGIGRIGKRPLGGEETELAIRAKQHWPQKIFLYEPEAVIHHCVPPQRTRWRYFAARCYAEGLSKAHIASYVGAQDSLLAERQYIARDLPRGIMRYLGHGLWQRDPAGFLRAGALIAGLLITTGGYLVGTVLCALKADGEKHSAPLIETLPLSADEPVVS